MTPDEANWLQSVTMTLGEWPCDICQGPKRRLYILNRHFTSTYWVCSYACYVAYNIMEPANP